MHKRVYNFTTPTPKSHNVFIGSRGVTKTIKMHKTQNKTKHTGKLNPHKYTQANTLPSKYERSQSTGRTYI